MATFKDLGEFGFIDRIAAQTQQKRVRCGIGDDCAVIDIDEVRVRLVTADLMVEGVHFLIDAPPEGVGHKLLAVSLSDIASMGGAPTDAVVSVAAPGDCDTGYVERIYTGLYATANRFGVVIVGGDTTGSPGPLMLNLTLTGEMARARVCYRSGAKPGDLICVSGTLGDAAGGLAIMRGEVDLSGEDRAHLLRRLHRPEPRVALGQALAETGAVTAMIDVSDGVASDMGHICRQSGVSGIIREAAVPMSEPFRRFCTAGGHSAIDVALSGGEDYELLFTVSPDRWEAVAALSGRETLPVIHRIGKIAPGDGIVLIERGDGTRVSPAKLGYDHFRA